MNYNYNEQVERIINYIKDGEKPKNLFKIGVEFEHFVIDKNTLNTISYYGENGVGSTIKELCNFFNAVPIMDGDFILGFETDDYSVSTEPGAQFELSVVAQKSVTDLERKYKNFMQIALPFFEKKGQFLLALGYHPKTKIDEIKILPKKRYDYMFNYFKSKGNMAHNMMKGTASVQVSIDFENEYDFKKKYFLANAISPILYTIFDNSPIFENKPYKKHNLRQTIWENTDPDRSGTLKIAFDDNFSYKKYAEFILNTTPIFIDKNKKLQDVNELPFKSIFDPKKDNDDLIYHALSIVFPDIRAKKYLEFRMMDAVKMPYNFGAAALIEGLFYNKNNLERLYEMYREVKYEDVINAKKSSAEKGLLGIFLNKTIFEHATVLLNIAHDGLSDIDRNYLMPLFELLNSNSVPKNEFEKTAEKYGLKEAVFKNKIEVENV
ncbi:glutamate--cysteine ligase [Peptoniphilus sp. oral taxon 386]|uniref:glutamate--cysteine ligase n=1 Tax=Peptoniphilus sp. oral taxon 386 TaxID=652713 RepID=UPI0001DA9D10|nr:glutamate-cysteine ligase family protein [Peptoniphilus sp. oral taxon 386]EFI42488.1 putative glutamate--cysteine ligase [Peptoniphilus sp. oral taxon 386 str. F0131]